EREASKRECQEMSLEVRSDNKQAIGFYEKHRYKVVDSLPGYYSDGASGLRMVKPLQQSGGGEIQLKIPYYGQTLEFTCGSACLMMVFKYFTPDLTLNRLLELTLWREATLVFMTSGMGGCGPFGLALATQTRGYPVKVLLSREQSPFFSSVRNEDKRQVIRIIHDDLQERALAAGVRVKYQDVTFKDIAREMKKGRIPIVLISTYRLHGDRAPHWVVLTGFDSDYVYFHDSYEGFYEHDRKLARNIKIPISEFNRMKRYGKDLYKCVLFVDGPEKGL
ncbi:MAG TPA: peptidase C39 family protein, partial [candidate division Zixibacteria bacterium]|nr:peptidase C39 family protein [candidate division Zixibacteria bacterium]